MSDEKPIKREKQKLTDKQRAARLLNLQKGRDARRKNIEAKKNKESEYDIESEASESGSDDEVDLDSFVLKKRSKVVKEKKKEPNMHEELQELRKMMYQMAKEQKKAHKKGGRKEGTKIVLLPNQQQGAAEKPTYSAPYNKTLADFLAAVNKK